MSKEFRHIIRIADTDLDGALKVAEALTKIHGVGVGLSYAVLRKAGIDMEARLGFLSEAETKRIEDILMDPLKHGIPAWLLNRRKDLETGKDMHLLGSELVLRTKLDIDAMKNMKSWRGYRHSYGLKVRGQRTRVTGRKGKALGVKKKAVMKPAERKE
jgi:small subunit ribosomal protein S13